MDFQSSLNIAMQAAAPGLGIFMLLVSLLGLPEFYLIVIPLTLWCYDKTLGIRLFILLSICAGSNAVLKILFHAPRPYWVSSAVKAFASEPSFGMPSAAAQISLAFLGYIGARVKKTPVWAICIAVIILAGISRMYLGVHYLADILTGWIFGLIILLLFLHYENWAAEWFSHRSIPIRILLALCASLTLIILSQMLIFNLGSWQVPAGWSALASAQTGSAINPLSLGDVLVDAGLLFGAAAGAVLIAEYIPYSAGGSRSRKAIRFFTGISILVVMWGALSAATKSPGLPGQGMTYLRAVLAGVWITAGAPFLFCTLGLMNKGQKTGERQ
jgi:membrane-associated phospholipid phosphatase